ncbi:dickkopf-related protein 4 [Crotalus adamanteus]|uniref:Dickkopf-related protein 4 n=1 Tax=Crotalus adamanteus TaxID=8729 RepID=A0AAW1B076_CROAD|nr:dickkopf-related protein 4 [Crotalus tigris]
MEATFLLGLTCLCSPLTALVLDFNTIRGSSEVSTPRKSTQCLTDKDCRLGKYCYKPQEEQLPFCAPCQGLRRRCHGKGMCCPGMTCINDVCAQVAEEQRDGRQIDLSAKERRARPAQAGHVRKEGARPRTRSPAGTGERCLRTSDCAQGHCCARHFWAKICKPVLLEGAVCSGRGQKDGGAPGPEIFQRCGCASGLVCQRPLQGAPQRARLRVCRSS